MDEAYLYPLEKYAVDISVLVGADDIRSRLAALDRRELRGRGAGFGALPEFCYRSHNDGV
jgi:hypothetical protein